MHLGPDTTWQNFLQADALDDLTSDWQLPREVFQWGDVLWEMLSLYFVLGKQSFLGVEFQNEFETALTFFCV